MEVFNLSSKNLLFFLAPVSFLLLASCSSYQYSGNDDGIYGETNRVNERQNQNATSQDSDRSYYKNLFAEEAALYGEVLAEDAIFTDVESYTSTGDYQPGDQGQGYVGGNAPWGDDPDSYQVNIYNTGFHGGMFNPFWGGGVYAFDPFWGPGFYGPGWGPGFYGPGWGPGFWGRGFGGGWGMGFGGGWGMGFGGGWGMGYGMGFGAFGHPFFHGGGFYNPYNFYGNRYNNFRQNVAYNTGRRDAASYYQNRNNSSARSGNAIRNARNLDSRGRNSTYSRSIRNLRGSNDDYGLSRRAVSRSYDSRSNQYNTGRARVFDGRTTRSNNTYSRPVQTNRGAVRSAPATRSSGSVRSSGGGRSSSGGGRSSGGGSRGRGN